MVTETLISVGMTVSTRLRVYNERFIINKLNIIMQLVTVCSGIGSSPFPCDDDYAGDSVWSEPEVRYIRDHINYLSNNLTGYVSYHSAGQWWLSPWGYLDVDPPDYDEQVGFICFCGRLYRPMVLSCIWFCFVHMVFLYLAVT